MSFCEKRDLWEDFAGAVQAHLERRHPASVRPLIGTLATIFVLVVVTYCAHFLLSSKTSEKVILVADFVGPKPEEYGVSVAIRDELTRSVKEYPDIVVKALDEPIAESEGIKVARAIGEKSKATIVIWGYYLTPGNIVPISVNFEVIGGPKYLPPIGEDVLGNPRFMPMEDLQNFVLQTRLSHEMAYLSLFTLGMMRYSTVDWATATKLFTDALKQPSQAISSLDQSIVYYWRGQAYSKQGDTFQAIDDFSRCIEHDPKNALYYSARGEVYVSDKDYANALEDYNAAIALDPASPAFYYARGSIYEVQKDLEDSIADYEQAKKLDSSFVSAYYRLGLIYLFLGHLEPALANLDQCIELDPSHAWCYSARGSLHSLQYQLDQAADDYDSAIALQSKEPPLFLQRGVVLRALGNLRGGIADFSRVIYLEPDSAAAYFYRADSYVSCGQWYSAIGDYTRFIELSPTPIETLTAYFERGRAHLQISNSMQAAADFNKVIELRLAEGMPEDATVYLFRGLARYKVGNIHGGTSDFEKALALSEHTDQHEEIRKQLEAFDIKMYSSIP